jgi:hypothetical protein
MRIMAFIITVAIMANLAGMAWRRSIVFMWQTAGN